MYEEIVIPQAVYAEVTAKEDSVCRQIVSADWIQVEQIKDQSDKRMYKAKLHAGEVEVMILAQENEKEGFISEGVEQIILEQAGEKQKTEKR